MLPFPNEGRAAISCSKSFCKEEFGRFIAWASVSLSPEDFEKLPSWREVKDWLGKVVGVCDYAARARGTYAPTISAVADTPQPKTVREADALAGVRPPYQAGILEIVKLPNTISLNCRTEYP